MYLNHPQNRNAEAGFLVTDKAIIDACNNAEALDPTKDSPEMIMCGRSPGLLVCFSIGQRKHACSSMDPKPRVSGRYLRKISAVTCRCRGRVLNLRHFLLNHTCFSGLHIQRWSPKQVCAIDTSAVFFFNLITVHCIYAPLFLF